MKIDEFQDFRGQIKVLKEQNIQLIQGTVNELPQSKRDFLKNVLAVERVSNEPRKIFTIKRNKWKVSIHDIIYESKIRSFKHFRIYFFLLFSFGFPFFFHRLSEGFKVLFTLLVILTYLKPKLDIILSLLIFF